MSVAYNKFLPFVADVCNGYYNLASDTCKIALSNTSITSSWSALSSVTQISNGNGYTTGGTAIGSPSSTQTSGTETFSGNNVTFTATGTVGPFEYAVLTDSSANSSHNLIAWWDYGSALTLGNGDTFTIQFNGGASSGTIFTMA